MIWVICCSIITLIIIGVIKPNRVFLFRITGVNMVISKNVEYFKSKLKCYYLRSASYGLFFGWLFIVTGFLYQYIFMIDNKLKDLLVIIVIFPIFSRRFLLIGLKLYKK